MSNPFFGTGYKNQEKDDGLVLNDELIFSDYDDVYSIERQTGWKRPYPFQICQDSEVLLKVTKFNYDLTDKKFIEYVKSRTGIVLDSINGFLILDSIVTEMWKKLMKAKIQDCWELYKEMKNE